MIFLNCRVRESLRPIGLKIWSRNLILKKNLIIAGDRLKLSDLPEYTKHPIILPNKDLLVELLILHVHQKNHHSPQDTTIAILKERYHILHIREEVRRVCNGVWCVDMLKRSSCNKRWEFFLKSGFIRLLHFLMLALILPDRFT